LGKIETLVVHHTATPTSWTVAKIRQLHLDRGWRDVGYHYLIRLDEDKTARVYMGRPQDGDNHLSSLEIGAHVKGHNSTSLGISTIGNWSNKAMEPAIERVLVQHLVKLCLKLELKPNDVKGHREMEGASTECPGLLVDMDRLRSLIDKQYKAVKRLLGRKTSCQKSKKSGQS
jgi:N-acetyl-anhydromuramyl-L-alanine amidase AmpD